MPTERITSLPDLPQRPPDAHKGTFGRVLVVAGSRGMSGAACLSGLGALRGGAGLVYVATAAGVVPVVASVEPSYLTIPLTEDDEGRISDTAGSRITEAATNQDAVAIGPGLGQSDGLAKLVSELYRSMKLPLVVDADALNLLSRTPEVLCDHAGPRILTPHPGEFARLTGTGIGEIQRNRENAAADFAAAQDVVLVLKGAGTVVTDGRKLAVNETGNSGMATGGSGDVLTGLLAALLAQRMPPFDAARLGVHLHGLAGDIAAAELSEPALIASDLPRYVGAAWKRLAKG